MASIVEIHCAISCASAAASKPFIHHHVNFLRIRKSKKMSYVNNPFSAVKRKPVCVLNFAATGKPDVEINPNLAVEFASFQKPMAHPEDHPLHAGSENTVAHCKGFVPQSQQEILRNDDSSQKRSRQGKRRLFDDVPQAELLGLPIGYYSVFPDSSWLLDRNMKTQTWLYESPFFQNFK